MFGTGSYFEKTSSAAIMITGWLAIFVKIEPLKDIKVYIKRCDIGLIFNRISNKSI